MHSDVAWPILERKPENIFHAPTYPLVLDKDRVRKIRLRNSCAIGSEMCDIRALCLFVGRSHH